MSVWKDIHNKMKLESLITFELSETEYRVVSNLMESIMLEHVRINLREGQSPWDALNEGWMDSDYWSRGTKMSDEQIILNDKEAAAITSASGRGGPANKMQARKLLMDPNTAMTVYRAINSNPQKYSAMLGGTAGYSLLIKKISRQLRDKFNMGSKQLNPPTSPPVVDKTKVKAQDIASMQGAKSSQVRVQDPQQQKKEPGMEDPTKWFSDEE